MDFQTIAAIVFVVLLALILYIKRKNLQVEKILFPILYFIMYRTKWGLASMDSTAKKHNRLMVILGYIGIVVGFAGMAFIIYMLVLNVYNLFFVAGTVSGIAPVLPVKAKGVFYVPFFYWIISIFIIAVVHEFSHGVIARAHNIKIKSSGLAFLSVILPIIPAAFVEPDENELRKKSRAAQLSVFAAGPFSNIVLAFVILGLLFLLAPVLNGMSSEKGIEVVSLVKDANGVKPAEAAGISEGVIIVGIDNNSFTNTDGFMAALGQYKAGDKVIVYAADSVDSVGQDSAKKQYEKQYEVTLGAKPGELDKPYLGVTVKPVTETSPEFIKKYGTVWPRVLLWISGLLWLLILLNLGIGLFNLVPLGPVDGGRMLLVGLEGVMEKKNAELTWKIISYVFLILIAIGLIFTFIK